LTLRVIAPVETDNYRPHEADALIDAKAVKIGA